MIITTARKPEGREILNFVFGFSGVFVTATLRETDKTESYDGLGPINGSWSWAETDIEDQFTPIDDPIHILFQHNDLSKAVGELANYLISEITDRLSP